MQFILFNQIHTLLADAETNRHESTRIKNKLPPISKIQELARADRNEQELIVRNWNLHEQISFTSKSPSWTDHHKFMSLMIGGQSRIWKIPSIHEARTHCLFSLFSHFLLMLLWFLWLLLYVLSLTHVVFI